MERHLCSVSELQLGCLNTCSVCQEVVACCLLNSSSSVKSQGPGRMSVLDATVLPVPQE